jgi:hypothetical protein
MIKLIKDDGLGGYYIDNIKFLPGKCEVKFELINIDKNMPGILMDISYTELLSKDNLFINTKAEAVDDNFLVTAVAEYDLSKVGELITRSLSNLFRWRKDE